MAVERRVCHVALRDNGSIRMSVLTSSCVRERQCVHSLIHYRYYHLPAESFSITEQITETSWQPSSSCSGKRKKEKSHSNLNTANRRRSRGCQSANLCFSERVARISVVWHRCPSAYGSKFMLNYSRRQTEMANRFVQFSRIHCAMCVVKSLQMRLRSFNRNDYELLFKPFRSAIIQLIRGKLFNSEAISLFLIVFR